MRPVNEATSPHSGADSQTRRPKPGAARWALFSDAALSGRGNSYVPLIARIPSGGIGLIMLALGVLSLLPAPKGERKG